MAMMAAYYERPHAATGAAPAAVPVGQAVCPRWAISFGTAPIAAAPYAFLQTPVTGNVTGAGGQAPAAAGNPAFVRHVPAAVMYQGAPAGIPAQAPPGAPATYNDFLIDLYVWQQLILEHVPFG